MILWPAHTTSVCVFSLKSGGLHTIRVATLCSVWSTYCPSFLLYVGPFPLLFQCVFCDISYLCSFPDFWFILKPENGAWTHSLALVAGQESRRANQYTTRRPMLWQASLVAVNWTHSVLHPVPVKHASVTLWHWHCNHSSLSVLAVTVLPVLSVSVSVIGWRCWLLYHPFLLMCQSARQRQVLR